MRSVRQFGSESGLRCQCPFRVIRDGVVPAASLAMSAVYQKRLNCFAATKRRGWSLVFAPGRPRPHKHADQKVLICDGPRPPIKPDAEKRFFLSPPKSSFILGMEVGVRW